MLMIGKQLTEEQRLTRALSDIIGSTDYADMPGILMLGAMEIVEHGARGVTTAATNGLDTWFSRKFVGDLNDAELRFLILHESYHVVYRHLTTYTAMYELDPQCANMACDYVINIKLLDYDAQTARRGFITMPKVGLMDVKYRGMDSVEVFKLLREEKEQQQQQQPQPGQPGQGQGAGQPAPGKPAPGQVGEHGGMDQHDWEGAQSMTEGEKKEIDRQVDEALRQGALLASKVGSGGSRQFDALLQCKIDWREVLREFVSTTCTGSDYSTWRRPNRRFIGMNIYLPSGVSEAVGELVIAIDTSGSIGGKELQIFLSEVRGICEAVKPSAVRILYWDTEVCRAEYYAQEELDKLVTSTKPAGGGGTIVECVPAYMTKHSIKPQAVVVITDGYLGGGWGTWNSPVLWCVVNNKSAKPDVGKAVHMDFEY